MSPYILALMFAVTSVWHLLRPQFFIRLTPPWVPRPILVNRLVTLGEATLAATLCMESTRPLALWGALFLLVAVSPVHIHMLRVPEASLGLPRWFLWGRILGQIALLAWVYSLL